MNRPTAMSARTTRRPFTILTAVLFAVVFLVGAPRTSDAQSSRRRSGSPVNLRLNPAADKDTNSTGGGAAAPSARGADSKNAGSKAAGSTDAVPEAAGDPAASTEGRDSEAGFLSGMVRAIRRYSTWIIASLLGGVGLVCVWAFLPRRRSSGGEEAFAELGPEKPAKKMRGRKFSSTRIQAADVNEAAGGVEMSEVETSREYALVVDEKALKMSQQGENVDEHTGQPYADSRSIESYLSEKRYDDAYNEYLRLISADHRCEFHSDLEYDLSEHFLRQRDLEKAGRILEHHVATHAPQDIRADTYFNLGYIHFVNRTLQKSRRFLKLFVQKAENSRYVGRAQAILDRLDTLSRQN